MAINTDISAMVDRQTGSQFGGNLIQALGMMQRGKQAEKEMAFRDKQQAFENNLRIQKFEADQRDAERTYNLLQTNLYNEQADKDALAAITERAAGDLDKLDEELATFSPKSIFGIRAHSGLQGQLKTHLMEKKAATTKNYFEDSARKNLDPEDYAVWLNMENNPETGIPGSDKITFLNERVVAKRAAGDKGVLEFEEVDIGGKPFTSVRAKGSANFRLIPHEAEGDRKFILEKWKAAARLHKSLSESLADTKKTLKPENFESAKSQRDAVAKQMDELEIQMRAPVAAPAAVSPASSFSPEMGDLKESERQMQPTEATVTTKEAFDALPSGAIYTGKDGRKYRKP